MLIARRAFVRAIPALALLLSPFIVGALPSPLSWALFVGSSAVVVYAFVKESARAKKITLVLASLALTITASDLALRFFPLVPNDLVEKWPRMPLVYRYVPDFNYEGYRFNDLSRMAGVREWREEKWVRVVTDSAGFGNERPDETRLFDLILLGDSFGAGAVSHEHTWTSILAGDYNLNTYNLSAPAVGPGHEYVNLWAEKDRLKAGEGAVLIWQLLRGMIWTNITARWKLKSSRGPGRWGRGSAGLTRRGRARPFGTYRRDAAGAAAMSSTLIS